MKSEINNSHHLTIMENIEEDAEEKNYSDEDNDDDDDEHDEDEKYLALLQFQRICSRNQELQRLYGDGEDSEGNSGGMWWTAAARSMGAALSIITPIALISILFRHDSFIFRIFNQCDRAIRSVFFPAPVKRDNIIKWLQETLPGDKRTKSLDAVWSDGSVLCDLVESVVPGSCTGHHHDTCTRIDLTHGQRLAEQYLGVTPIFSSEELSNTILSTYQECRLTHYLNSVREAIVRLSPPVSRCGSPLLNLQAFTLDYVARGMGLVSAFKNRKSTFYLYPTAQQSLEPGDISVQIKGPGNCYGSILIPVIYGRAHIIRNMFFNMDKQNYPTIPMMQIDYQTSNVSQGSLNSKVKNDIEVSIMVKHDRVKVTYVPIIAGYHELSLISKGCHLMGSPFSVNVELTHEGRQYSSDCLEEDVIVEEKSKIERKIVFRIVDFVTEKMLLTEDGTLEKISASEAESLIKSMEKYNTVIEEVEVRDIPSPCLLEHNTPDIIENNRIENASKFGSVVNRVVVMMRVCKNFANLNKYFFKSEQKNKIVDDINANFMTAPDIVNSTIGESKNYNDQRRLSAENMRNRFKNKTSSFNSIMEDPKPRLPIEILISSIDEDDNVKTIPYRSACPTPIDEIVFERPKTPVGKLLEDDDSIEIDRPISPYIDFHIGEPVSPVSIRRTAKCKMGADIESIILAPNLEEALNKFDQKLQIDEESDGSSIFTTPLRQTPFEQMTDSEILQMYEGDQDIEVLEVKCDDDNMHEFNVQKGGVAIVKDKRKLLTPDFSFNSNSENSCSNPSTRNNSIDTCTWDSAYVSIDEINSSPDSNSTNSTNANSPRPPKLFCIEESENEAAGQSYSLELFKNGNFEDMGPAEREIWKTMAENMNKNENDCSKSAVSFLGVDESGPKNDSDSNPETIGTKQEEFKINKDVNNLFQRVETIKPTENKTSKKSKKHDGSASDNRADVNQYISTNDEFENEISSKLVNKNDDKQAKKPQLSKMVSEKKDYWDEKIKKSMEHNDEEKKLTKKKSNILRRNDSLSKKRAKQTNAKSSNMADKWKQTFETNNKNTNEEAKYGGSLVSKWKNYWNEKVEKSLSPEPDYFDSKLNDDIRKYSDSFLELNGEEENPLVSTLPGDEENKDVLNSNKYQPKVLNLSKLSERIDIYMKTASPVQELEHSVSSTPDFYRSTPTKPNISIILNKGAKINNFTSANQFSDEIFDPIEECKENTPGQFSLGANEAELMEIQKISNVKAKIELIRSASFQDPKDLFAKTRSQTIDLPKSENFHKLRKHFSVGVLDTNKRNNLQITFRNISKNETGSRTLGGEEVEKNQQSDGSTESLVSISERKLRIENHLKEIQSRRLKQNLEISNNEPKPQKEIPRVNVIKNQDCKADARYEDLESSQRLAKDIKVVKPIGKLVAAFESISKAEENIPKPKAKQREWPARIAEDKVFGYITDNIRDAENREGTTAESIVPVKICQNATEIPTSNTTDEAEDLIKSDTYKKQFRKTKQFFQNLDQSNKETVRARPLNECEVLLLDKMQQKSDDKTVKTEIEEKPVRPKRLKRIHVKANSAPSSDTECELRRISWHNQHGEKLIKISERFLVEDLFRDIAGESTRTTAGIFKGIPHKDAVLAAFRSMDSVNQLSSYEYCTTEMENFARKNGVVNSQTYHSEFPYLPTTDPSKYRSRYDASASGLMMRRDLLRLRKARRNSAPDESTTFSFHMITNV